MSSGPYPLEGRIQNYAWGGHAFIPRFLGFQPEPHTPYAEYWLGAHQKAPATVLLEDDITADLDSFIAKDARHALGHQAARQFGQLPYLFKVLDVEQPLSIQVHPTKAQAEAGYARESNLGIPLDAPERNYKDRNHKPELMVALSEFWLLHGFLPEARLRSVLRDVPEFGVLLPIFERGGYAELYRRAMTLPAHQVDAILGPLVERVGERGGTSGWEKASPEYWVARALEVGGSGPLDRGLFSIYFFNLVRMRPGEAIFQDAGIPHAYLQGQNVEIMANSDNVLRGGLTPKHVDVPELLKTVRFVGIEPRVTRGTTGDDPLEAFYESETLDFRLSRVRLGTSGTYRNTARSAEILLVMAGAVGIHRGDKRLSLGQGQSLVAFADTSYSVRALSSEADLFRVSLP
jgi:mannose-6-phosphate isomerase